MDGKVMATDGEIQAPDGEELANGWESTGLWMGQFWSETLLEEFGIVFGGKKAVAFLKF